MVRTFTSSDGLTIQVGENAGENQSLCRSAKQKDIWFHLDGSSSPHAILSVGDGKGRRDHSVRECCQLVKHYSSARFVMRDFQGSDGGPRHFTEEWPVSNFLMFVASLVFRNMGQAVVIWIEAKWVSKSGVEDRLGAVTLKKSPNRVTVVTDDATLERVLAATE